MARWEPGAGTRMQEAALDLFAERGFAAVTTQDIAARAGVTERTFFRHFATKEDVLFTEDAPTPAELLAIAEDAGPHARPQDVALLIGEHLAARFEPDRSRHRRRFAVVAAEPALLERDLLKQDRWARAIAEVLAERGLPTARALAPAGAATATFRAVYADWVRDEVRTPLAQRLRSAFEDLAHDLA